MLNVIYDYFARRGENKIVYLFPVLLFMDPRVFFRTFLQNDSFGVIFVLIILIVVGAFLAKVHALTGVLKERPLIIMVLFFLIAVVSRTLGEIKLAYNIQYLPIVVYCGLIYVLTKSDTSTRILLRGFAFAMFLHLLTIMLPVEFIQAGLSEQTAYEYSGSASLVGRRQTGFFASPGFLVLHSVIGLALGFVLFVYERKMVWLLLFVSSLVCGIATGNRSFPLAVFFFIILLPLFVSFNRARRLVLVIVPIIISLVVANFFVTQTDYRNSIEERFSGNLFDEKENDRLGGKTGIFEAIEAVKYSPWLGSVQAGPRDGEGVFAFNGRNYVIPHLSILAIAAHYGVIMAGIFLAFILVSIKRLTSRMAGTSTALQKAFLAGMLMAFLICLVEPLYETPVCLLCIFYGINFLGNVHSRKEYHLYLSTGARGGGAFGQARF